MYLTNANGTAELRLSRRLDELILAGLSGTLTPDEHAVLVLDNAGWHVAKALAVPNITLLFLPAYSLELNPVERLWAWPPSHHTWPPRVRRIATQDRPGVADAERADP